MDGNAIALIGGLAGLVILAVLFGVTVWLAWWMLEPINRAGGALNAPTRFMLIDFLALMVLLQVGLAICGRALSAQGTSDGAARMYWALLTVVAVLAVVLWLASVSVVSRAGILRPRSQAEPVASTEAEQPAAKTEEPAPRRPGPYAPR